MPLNITEKKFLSSVKITMQNLWKFCYQQVFAWIDLMEFFAPIFPPFFDLLHFLTEMKNFQKTNHA